MKRIFFLTLGCKVNQYETEAMQKLFAAAGWQIVEEISAAAVVVINTCTVTAVSSQKSRQMIRRAAKKNCLTVVVGCYAQSEPEEVAKIAGVDVIIGTKDRTKIVALVEAALATREKIFQVGAVEDIREFEELPHTPHR
ncbi:MAG: tRNA (N(6)-L-threonylcarbamoyladenosine(37)-C(2))-methylthiotransferase MtaB, partial [Selenomonadaceae bacterium]|nr:tRNA (N(6)-L-threonylcarbamoyladenosine(37)-C(2))-methylthiotransferase MtaB [Selenomonadaceae bacterium]